MWVASNEVVEMGSKHRNLQQKAETEMSMVGSVLT